MVEKWVIEDLLLFNTKKMSKTYSEIFSFCIHIDSYKEGEPYTVNEPRQIQDLWEKEKKKKKTIDGLGTENLGLLILAKLIFWQQAKSSNGTFDLEETNWAKT